VNSFDGGGGGDVLVGLGGDDLYFVRSNDRVVEAAGGGSDRVLALASFALEAGSQVELLTTADNLGSAAINLTGNEFAQFLYGNAGANRLDGKAGADVLTGLGGADLFAFTSALGSTNVDRITDFQAGIDKIALDHGLFAGLGLGALNPNAFFAGGAAHDADDRIVYNAATGQILFDADGSGLGAAVLFATLDTRPALAAGDFTVI
jgi:serralysin